MALLCSCTNKFSPFNTVKSSFRRDLRIICESVGVGNCELATLKSRRDMNIPRDLANMASESSTSEELLRTNAGILILLPTNVFTDRHIICHLLGIKHKY